MDQYCPWPVRDPATRQEVSFSVKHLNHPETIPHPTPPPPAPGCMDKLSSTKPVHGAKKVGDRWSGVVESVRKRANSAGSLSFEGPAGRSGSWLVPGFPGVPHFSDR